MIGPMDKDPSDLGVDLIIQLGGEGAVETTWPKIHPHCHLPSSDRLDMTADECPQEVRTR
jgi:hypothetical protein